MSANIDQYLEMTLASCQKQPKGSLEYFRIPAIQLLLQSREYKTGHWQRLRFVAQDLKRVNLAEIKLAQKYPDIFHPNVAISRQEENRIFDEVIELIQKLHHPKTA